MQKGLVSQSECKKIAKFLHNKYFPGINGLPVELKFIKRISSYKYESRHGLKNLVVPKKDPTSWWKKWDKAVVKISDNERKNIESVFDYVLHELHHIQDIVENRLQFKGNSLVWCGKEYKLRHVVFPGEQKGCYVHTTDWDEYRNGDMITRPWEAFDSFAARVSQIEAQEWISSKKGEIEDLPEKHGKVG